MVRKHRLVAGWPSTRPSHCVSRLSESCQPDAISTNHDASPCTLLQTASSYTSCLFLLFPHWNIHPGISPLCHGLRARTKRFMDHTFMAEDESGFLSCHQRQAFLGFQEPGLSHCKQVVSVLQVSHMCTLVSGEQKPCVRDLCSLLLSSLPGTELGYSEYFRGGLVPF